MHTDWLNGGLNYGAAQAIELCLRKLTIKPFQISNFRSFSHAYAVVLLSTECDSDLIITCHVIKVLIFRFMEYLTLPVVCSSTEGAAQARRQLRVT